MNEKITRRHLDEVGKEDLTDWDRVRNQTDEEIDAAIADDPDWQPFEDMSEVREIVSVDGDEWAWSVEGRTGKTLARSPTTYASQEAALAGLAQLREAFAKFMRAAA